MHYQPSPCAAPLLRPALSATPIALAAAAMVLALATPALHAQPTASPATAGEGKALSTVTVNASADASAQGLSPAYPGGQVEAAGATAAAAAAGLRLVWVAPPAPMFKAGLLCKGLSASCTASRSSSVWIPSIA